jgi:glutamate racemase
MKAGVFDSGIGGLSVLHEAMREHPELEYIFYADVDHVPYGTKKNEEILQYADEIVSFLVDKGADAVLIACNTASAVAVSYLRDKYDLPIIAMEPAVRPALKEEESKRILVMATPVTLRENKLKELLHREHGEERSDLLPMPGLVEFAEREEFDTEEVRKYLKQQLYGYDLREFSSIVLGCTHFNYFKPVLRSILEEMGASHVELIDGAKGTVRRLADLMQLEEKKADEMLKEEKLYFDSVEEMKAHYSVSYYFSGREASREEEEHILRMHKQLEKALKS